MELDRPLELLLLVLLTEEYEEGDRCTLGAEGKV